MNNLKKKLSVKEGCIYQDLLRNYAPPFLLINQYEEILLVNGEIEKYLSISAKIPGRLLSELVTENIYQEVLKGINEIAQGEESLLIDGRSFKDSPPFYMYITSFFSRLAPETLILIEFEDIDEQNMKNIRPGLPSSEINRQYEAIFSAAEHDIRNLINNFIMLLKLENPDYSTDDKIRDIKETQAQLLSNFKKNLRRLQAYFNFPSLD